MILVDTSVWVHHLRRTQSALVTLLQDDLVLCHPWIIGELSLGSLKDRSDFLPMLGILPRVQPLQEHLVFDFIEKNRLFSRGIGWVDAQLLAACISWPARLWSADKKMNDIAHEMGIGWAC